MEEKNQPQKQAAQAKAVLPEGKPKQPWQAKELTEQDKQKLLQLSEVSLWIDSYTEIFSDFDPRPYSERALSDDFLYEAKKAVKEKPSGKIELKFLTPDAKRVPKDEETIKKRLRGHFKARFEELQKEEMARNERGIAFVFAGVALMFVATYILLNLAEPNLWGHFLVVLLEPGGWFLFWEGLNMVIFKQKKEREEFVFYRKMSKCGISFTSY